MDSLKQKVYDNLLSDILDGIYPLDFIFNEKYLIDKYHVSRSPVRDALIELCNENILRCIPRYGYEIVRVSQKEIRDITQFRMLIEVEIFQQTCRKYREEMLEQIRFYREFNNSEINCRTPNLLLLWKNNIAFHRMLISFGGNAYVEKALEKALSLQFRAYSQLYWEKRNSSPPEIDFAPVIAENHVELEEALLNCEFDKAVEVLKRDIGQIPAYIRNE